MPNSVGDALREVYPPQMGRRDQLSHIQVQLARKNSQYHGQKRNLTVQATVE